MTEPKRLYRSRTDQQISGVCAGLAQYFAVDVTWVRVAFVLLALLNGGGVLLYIVLSIVIPVEPSEGAETQSANLEKNLREGAQNLGERAKELAQQVRGGRPQYLGWALVGVGVWFLLNQLGWIRINEDLVFPLILIGIGVMVLMRRQGGST